MEKEIKTTLWVEDGALRIRTYVSDFDSDSGNEWKKSFYELWRYQMTWDYAYEIKVHEVHGGDVCVSMLIKKAYEKQALDLMEYLGYRNVRVENEHVGIVHMFDIDDPVAMDVSTIIADAE